MALLGYNGGLRGKPRIPSTGNASGLWDLEEHQVAKGAGIWPTGVTGNYSLYLTVVNASTGGPGTWFPGYDNPQNAFDGNPSTAVGCANGSYLKFEPSVPIPFTTSLEIGGMEPGWDSVTIYTTSGSETQIATWPGVVFFTGPRTLLYFTVQDRPTTYYVVGFNYVKVDGVELVDPT